MAEHKNHDPNFDFAEASAPRGRPPKGPRKKGTNVHSSIAGISVHNALMRLARPPQDAVPGSKEAPWLRLTDWEMMSLRKRMKKNAKWRPSQDMIKVELINSGRGPQNYWIAKAGSEAKGSRFIDEDNCASRNPDKALTLGEISLTGNGGSSPEPKPRNRGMMLNEAKKRKREESKSSSAVSAVSASVSVSEESESSSSEEEEDPGEPPATRPEAPSFAAMAEALASPFHAMVPAIASGRAVRPQQSNISKALSRVLPPKKVARTEVPLSKHADANPVTHHARPAKPRGRSSRGGENSRARFDHRESLGQIVGKDPPKSKTL